MYFEYEINKYNKTYNVPKWNQVCNSDKCKYKSCTLKLSRDIVIPSEALLCRDAKCEMHIHDIDCFYKAIMSSLKQATNECIPSSKILLKYVKEQHMLKSNITLQEMHLNGGI